MLCRLRMIDLLRLRTGFIFSTRCLEGGSGQCLFSGPVMAGLQVGICCLLEHPPQLQDGLSSSTCHVFKHFCFIQQTQDAEGSVGRTLPLVTCPGSHRFFLLSFSKTVSCVFFRVLFFITAITNFHKLWLKTAHVYYLTFPQVRSHLGSQRLIQGVFGRESVFFLIHIVGRVQFLVAVGLKFLYWPANKGCFYLLEAMYIPWFMGSFFIFKTSSVGLGSRSSCALNISPLLALHLDLPLGKVLCF